jgi:hypothetical protein
MVYTFLRCFPHHSIAAEGGQRVEKNGDALHKLPKGVSPPSLWRSLWRLSTRVVSKEHCAWCELLLATDVLETVIHRLEDITAAVRFKPTVVVSVTFSAPEDQGQPLMRSVHAFFRLTLHAVVILTDSHR